MNDKLSLVTSFYNGYDKHLKAWLDAVLLGTQLPDEIVLVVSGEKYDQENIIAAEKCLKDKVPYQIIYVTHKSMGQARNAGVQVAINPWIMYLNVDDKVTPDAIAIIKQNLSEKFDILIGSMEWIGHATKSGIRLYSITRESILQGGITNDHSIYKKSIWGKSNYIEYSGDIDMAFWLGLVQEGAIIKCIPEVLTIHYFSPDTVFGKYSKEDLQEIRRMMAIWRIEGVHSKRFDSPEYTPKGDYGFEHSTTQGLPSAMDEEIALQKRVSIVMAYRPDNGIRDLHKKWTEQHFHEMFPYAEIICVTDTKDEIGWGTFNKSKLLNQGVRQAHGDIIFITDIDMVFIKNKLLHAFEQAYCHSLIFPMNMIYYLPEDKTKHIMKTVKTAIYPRVDVAGERFKKRDDRQANGSYVITKNNYLRVGGHDERFVGWGSEDSAFIKSVTTLIDLPYLRMQGPSLHLYHPTVKDRFVIRDSGEKVGLNQQYQQAKDHKELMIKILEERGIKYE